MSYKEREPDFEDEKIRLWRAAKDQPLDAGERDPTTLDINAETEEIYESRTYGMRFSPEIFGLFLQSLGERVGDLDDSLLPELLQRLEISLAEASIKILAKRCKQDGRITYLIVGLSPEKRTLLTREELVRESVYRKRVSNFEHDMLRSGIVPEPMVVTLKEWRRYTEMSLPPGSGGT